MLEQVIGVRAKPEVRNLLDELAKLDLNGILYVGYPILATADDTTLIDAMLITDEHGLVVFDLARGDPGTDGFWEDLQARQDQVYSAVYGKLFDHSELRVRRSLAVDVGVVTYVPTLVGVPPSMPEFVVAGPGQLESVLKDFDPLDEEYRKPLHAVVQRVTTIKPRKRRTSVKRENSRGAILKSIEREIANLDRWQSHASIESPEGPQRIRGLAGSGKTVVLALKAAYLHVHYPRWRIAITFQTRSLYQQFEDLVTRFTFEHVKDEPDFTQLRILHAWGGAARPGIYYDIASQYGFQPRDFSSASRQYGREGAFDGICLELLEQLEGRLVEPMYDAVLIDEAQDFPTSFFRLVHRVVADPKRIVWAYDELQNLGDFRMTPPEDLFGTDDRQRPLVTLHNRVGQPQEDIILPVCYRNTPWALATAHALGFGVYRDGGLVQYFDEADLWHKLGYEVVDGENSEGKRVTLARRSDTAPSFFGECLHPADAVSCHVFDGREEQATWLAESIRRDLSEGELEASDVLVILPDAYTAKSEANALLGPLKGVGLDAHLAGVTSSRDELFRRNSIAIAHIHRAKGNEAPMVYVLNSQYGTAGLEMHKRRNVLFTAITRSRAWVRMCGYGPGMEALKSEIDNVVERGYQLEFTVPTARELGKMRQIHRDRTREEQEELRKMEDVMATYVDRVERGDIAEDAISRELLDKLRRLLDSK